MRHSPRELIERIPPGEYPLQAAVLIGEGDYGGERFPVTEEPVVRLLIADEPPVTWEMGLSEGDDPRLLLDGHGLWLRYRRRGRQLCGRFRLGDAVREVPEFPDGQRRKRGRQHR